MANLKAEPSYSAGSINEISQMLYDELLTSGSSLLLSEVIKLLIASVKKYVAWAGGLQIKPDNDELDKLTGELATLEINEETHLTLDEWVIIDPVVRAHCDLIQAGRMEGAQSLGVAPSGVGKSEADMVYREALERMKKEAFQCEPFSISFTDEPRPLVESRYWII